MTATCSASILVRPGGKFFCELPVRHAGLHESHLSGQWESVMWTDGTEFMRAPGSWRAR